MISHPLLLLTLSAFLSGGSIHGVVVEKTFKPLPLADSLGVEGIYRLDLRQPDKSVRHQMVSREIFAAYQIGDEFNDQLSVADLRRLHEEEQEKAVAKAAESAAPKVKPKEQVSDTRFATLFRRQDMLPESEGF